MNAGKFGHFSIKKEKLKQAMFSSHKITKYVKFAWI